MAVLLYLIAAGYIRYITHIGERNDSGIFLFLLQVSQHSSPPVHDLKQVQRPNRGVNPGKQDVWIDS